MAQKISSKKRTLDILYFFHVTYQFIFFFLITVCTHACPPSASVAKISLQNFDFKNYYASVDRVMKEAEFYIDTHKKLKRNKHQKLFAIVLDIDETAISQREYMKQNNLTNNSNGYIEAMHKSTYPIKSVLKFYHSALSKNLSVFFITSREATLRSQTTQNLEKAGYFKWHGLIMRPNNFKGSSAKFKQEARKWLCDQGYYIVLNIGDQLSDIEGDYAEKKLKLPNPFYTIF